MFNVDVIKKDFPIFRNNPGLVYLDSTATSQKPQSVIDREVEYYEKYCANVYRGIYTISEKATAEFEQTRNAVSKFINAASANEIVFTRGATESLNLVAYALGRKIVGSGDGVVTSIMEHHSNFVPWQQLAFENGAAFKIIDVDDDGYLDVRIDKLAEIISKKTKILALTYVSNVLGTVNDIRTIAHAAKQINPKIIVVVDAAQAVPHLKVDVRALGCDFLAFSAHKMLGPTGVGVLWGKHELLNEMFPFNFGGEMIREVYLDRTVFKEPPHKFEAGTPHIAGVIAFKEAIDYLERIGVDAIRSHEITLVKETIRSLQENFGKRIRIFGPHDSYESDKAGVVTFTFDGYHAHDIAQILDEEGIAIRAGHHCAMPLHTKFGVVATARASFYLYNSQDDIHRLIQGLKKVETVLK